MGVRDVWLGVQGGFYDALPDDSRFQQRAKFYQDARKAHATDTAGVATQGWEDLNPRHAYYEGGGRKVGYGLGRFAGDMFGELSRGMYWRYNHPLAITYKAGEEIGKSAGFRVTKNNQVYEHPRAAALYGGGLALLMNVASGNFDIQNLDAGGRPRGYSAILPTPEDPTQSKAPLLEMPLGWLVGSRHKLLPYDKFVKERPDISPEEYQRQKDYQAWGEPNFFGLENANPVATAALGSGLGVLRTEHKHHPDRVAKNLGIGAVVGAATPGLVEGLSSLGVIRGTWNNMDNEPEAQLLGYKVPLSAVGITAVGGTAGYLLGRRFLRGRPGFGNVRSDY